MQFFQNEGVELAYLTEGKGDPVLLIHGFASSAFVNWVQPGWVQTLTDAGYSIIAIDNRGHGASQKLHETAVYTPERMAGDARALLDHLGISSAHVMGYSMGARISAFLALSAPDRVHSLVLGGLGMGLIHGVGDWDPIADALLAPDASAVTDPRGKMFRDFADRTKSDRLALAACIRTSRSEITEEQARSMTQPVLVGVGTKDDLAGDAHELAALFPNGRAVDIPGRDHMLAVGDRVFKKAVIEFLAENPL
ncbi:MAG: alpha/beta fold hydrolase [Phyllobacterium sp.]